MCCRPKPRLILVALAFFITGCGTLQQTITTEPTTAIYTPTGFAALNAWQKDDLVGIKESMLKSCGALQKKSPNALLVPSDLGIRAGDWLAVCQKLSITTQTDLRRFFQDNFTPYRITTPKSDTGLFTGYFEKDLYGSLTRSARFRYPLYKRPPELVMVELGDFRPNLKGERIAGSVIDGKLKPYATRAGIDVGALAGRGLELLWVDDPDAAFFLHVQGSGRVLLDNGRVVHVGYDGQNGHPYYAIGRALIARGELTPQTTSLATITAWLKAHPAQAQNLRAQNPSYVFFRMLPDDGAAVGAMGVPLTAQRSLAVDPRFIPYGVPVWVDAKPVQHLVIAQDTGGAIRGPIRGDFFWGSGMMAEERASGMKYNGAAYLLLPKNVRPAAQVSLVK